MPLSARVSGLPAHDLPLLLFRSLVRFGIGDVIGSLVAGEFASASEHEPNKLPVVNSRRPIRSPSIKGASV